MFRKQNTATPWEGAVMINFYWHQFLVATALVDFGLGFMVGIAFTGILMVIDNTIAEWKRNRTYRLAAQRMKPSPLDILNEALKKVGAPAYANGTVVMDTDGKLALCMGGGNGGGAPTLTPAKAGHGATQIDENTVGVTIKKFVPLTRYPKGHPRAGQFIPRQTT
jgi:hypothetical protein